jgi:cell division protein FtsN
MGADYRNNYCFCDFLGLFARYRNGTRQSKEEQKPEVKSGPKMPQFDFYTILPEKEVVVPEYEIKTRAREERVGKAKETHYLMQAGSFKTFKEADRLRAKLALMGIESKVEKAKVGSVNWYRVKMGPYVQTDSVNTIRARLRQNGIDVIITETGQ